LARRVRRIGPLPGGLIEELQNAIFAGNKILLDSLIQKVRESGDSSAAQVLQDLADKYDYDALSSLLEETPEG